MRNQNTVLCMCVVTSIILIIRDTANISPTQREISLINFAKRYGNLYRLYIYFFFIAMYVCVFVGFGRLSGDRCGHRAGENGGDQEAEGHH